MNVMILFIVAIATFLSINSSSDPQISMDSLCVIDQNFECVGADKSKPKKIENMIGYYSIDEIDLRKILNKLEQCKK